MPKRPLRLPSRTKDKTMPPEKIKLLLNGLSLPLKPARYAIVIGNRDKEQGPKLVKRPLINTIIRVNGPGSFKPVLINSSLLWARSEMAMFRKLISLFEGLYMNRLLTISS